MKTTLFPVAMVFALGFLLGSSHKLEARSGGTIGSRIEEQSSDTKHAITVDEYCKFLNAAAATDLYALYNEKMDGCNRLELQEAMLQSQHENKSGDGMIIRSGAPGSYQYDVIHEKENATICYVDSISAMHYSVWLEDAASTSLLNFNSCDAGYQVTDKQLRSNRISGHLILAATLREGLRVEKNGGWGSKQTTWNAIEEVVAVAAVVASADETRPLTVEEQRVEENGELPLVSSEPAAFMASSVISVHRFQEASDLNQTIAAAEAEQAITTAQMVIERMQAKALAIKQAKERSVAAAAQAVSAKEDSKMPQDSLSAAWDHGISLLEQASMSWAKVAEALIQENQEKVILWSQAAEASESFVAARKSAAHTHSLKNQSTQDHLENMAGVADHLFKVALCSLKSEEAVLTKEHKEVLSLWRGIIGEHQKLAAYYGQKALIEAKDKEDDILCYDKKSNSAQESGSHLNLASVALEKAIAAAKDKQERVSWLWRDIAQQHLKFSELYGQIVAGQEQNLSKNLLEDLEWRMLLGGSDELFLAAEALEQASIVAGENKEEFVLLKSGIAKRFQALLHYKIEAMSGSPYRMEFNRINEVELFAQRSVDALRATITALEKATAIAKEDQGEIAILWRKIVEQRKEAVMYWTAAMEYPWLSVTKRKAGLLAGKSAARLEQAVAVLEKATKRAKENQPEIVCLQNKIVERFKEAAEYNRRAAAALTSNNHEVVCKAYDRLNYGPELNLNPHGWDLASDRSGSVAKESAMHLEQAVVALEKAALASEKNKDLALLWHEIAVQYQQAAEYCHQAAMAIASENEWGYKAYYRASVSTEKSATQLRNSIYALEAIDVSPEKEGEIEALWRKSARWYQESSGYNHQAAVAIAGGQKIDYGYLDQAATSAEKSADQLEMSISMFKRTIGVTSEDEAETEILRRKSVKQYQEAAEHDHQAALAISSYMRFQEAGNVARKNADDLNEQIKKREQKK